MTIPRITIVTPSYNQAEFLEETLSSVLDQGYSNLEYMVLDGGSTDGSADIIRRYADHLTYWHSKPDDGQAAALREGFSRATGDILGWLNSDDVLAEGALAQVAEAWMQHGPGIAIAGACQVIDRSGERSIHTPRFQESFGVPQLIPLNSILNVSRRWLFGEYFYQPEVFFPRAAYDAVGGLDPSIYFTMDYDLWVRLALARTPVVVVPQVLATFREHTGQKTNDRTAVHRQLVETANGYLRNRDMPIGFSHRYLLMILNRIGVTSPVRLTARFLLRQIRKIKVA